MKSEQPNIARSVGAVLYLNEKPLAAQQGVSFERTMSPIEITNKITGSWQEYIAGAKSWKLSCNGMYVLNSNSFQELESAFMNDTPIDVKLSADGIVYTGVALITDFPLNATFDQKYKYSITLLGTGEIR